MQEMIQRPGAYELIAGVTTDLTFGPVILFGHGGTAVEIIRDKSLELPPLNTALARAQIERTRVAALLKGYRDRPAADIDGLVNVLMQLSNIVADHAEIMELDINPLLCDQTGVIGVDGRIRVQAASVPAQARLAIRPYPQQLETEIRTADGKVYAVRPIRPEDEPALRRFADEVDTADLWHAFFAPLRERTHETAARLSQIDYDREMTMLAWDGTDALPGSRAPPPIPISTRRRPPSSSAPTCARRASPSSFCRRSCAPSRRRACAGPCWSIRAILNRSRASAPNSVSPRRRCRRMRRSRARARRCRDRN